MSDSQPRKYRLDAKRHNFMHALLQGTAADMISLKTLVIEGPDEELSKLLQKAQGSSATPAFLLNNLIPIPSDLEAEAEDRFVFSELFKNARQTGRTAVDSMVHWKLSKNSRNWCLRNWGCIGDLNGARIDRRFEHAEIETYAQDITPALERLRDEYPHLTFQITD